MGENINYRCLHCGAELAWNPDAGTWKCEYCDTEFTLGELEEAIHAKAAAQEARRAGKRAGEAAEGDGADEREQAAYADKQGTAGRETAAGTEKSGMQDASGAWKTEGQKTERQETEGQEAEEKETEEGRRAEEGAGSTDGTRSAPGAHFVEYTCGYCGAKIITDETTAATFCAYCQSPVVISGQVTGAFAPERLIPFSKNKEQVMREYKSFVKKPLTPKLFLEENHIEKLTGIYIPFFLYRARSSGEVKLRGTRVTTWRSGDKRYTKTDTYLCEISGSMEFENVPVDASSKTDDGAMDSIEPFSFEKLVPFSPAYLAGFMAERYDISMQEAEARMERRVDQTLKNKLMQEAPAYDTAAPVSEQLDHSVLNRSYVFLPVWLLNTKYKGKDYLFAMNGQTGNFVGNLPIDRRKLLLYGAGIFLGSFLIFWLLAWAILRIL